MRSPPPLNDTPRPYERPRLSTGFPSPTAYASSKPDKLGCPPARMPESPRLSVPRSIEHAVDPPACDLDNTETSEFAGFRLSEIGQPPRIPPTHQLSPTPEPAPTPDGIVTRSGLVLHSNLK
ncbi:hypothetical protein GE061_011749 [Apolygus lucorum]|uniref:Uncharacterized protein n=1 Tax=Apolygus lucorum TaxID=248454 RepID=A0A6A4JWR0_APOLU|nr:hypothetical protein GE061_011749 [Apolygus lucorum]